jgi:hypothetical protein
MTENHNSENNRRIKMKTKTILNSISMFTFGLILMLTCSAFALAQDYPTDGETRKRPPTVAEIKATMEEKLTDAHGRDYDKVEFQWVGDIKIGSLEKRGDPTRFCYPAKLNVDVIRYYKGEIYGKPIRRGTQNKDFNEVFCFFKDGFGDWDFVLYFQ